MSLKANVGAVVPADLLNSVPLVVGLAGNAYDAGGGDIEGTAFDLG